MGKWWIGENKIIDLDIYEAFFIQKKYYCNAPTEYEILGRIRGSQNNIDQINLLKTEEEAKGELNKIINVLKQQDELNGCSDG